MPGRHRLLPEARSQAPGPVDSMFVRHRSPRCGQMAALEQPFEPKTMPERHRPPIRPRRDRWPALRSENDAGEASPVARRAPGSSPVDRPGPGPVLVDPARQMEALEEELHRRRDDRRLLRSIRHIERAEPADRLVETRDLGHPADVLTGQNSLPG